jgi:hypothetical protein
MKPQYKCPKCGNILVMQAKGVWVCSGSQPKPGQAMSKWVPTCRFVHRDGFADEAVPSGRAS